MRRAARDRHPRPAVGALGLVRRLAAGAGEHRAEALADAGDAHAPRRVDDVRPRDLEVVPGDGEQRQRPEVHVVGDVLGDPLDVAAKLANADTNFQKEIPLDETEAEDVTTQVAEYFGLESENDELEAHGDAKIATASFAE